MPLMGVPVQGILFTVFQSIFQVFLLCLAGFVLSFKGIIDKRTSKALNHINIALFTPALLFSKVAYFLTPAKLRQLWVIPIFFCILTGLSAVIAHWLARACRLKRSQVNFATAASMFMNSNSLPVALMQSLATTVPLLRWGTDDNIDAMFGRSLTYLVVFSTLGMITLFAIYPATGLIPFQLRWSYGVRLLSQADEPESPPSTAYRDVEDIDQQPARVAVVPSPLVDHEAEADNNPCDCHVWRTRPLRPRRIHLHLTPLARRNTYPHARHSHLPAVPTSLGDQSESEDTDEPETEGDSEDTLALRSDHVHTGFSTETEGHLPTPALASLPSSPTPRWNRPARPPIFIRLLTSLTSLSPPLVASLFSLFCVLVPPLQRSLQSEEMIPFKGALDSAGACSIPLTMLVLGGWFWDDGSKQRRKHGDETKTQPSGQGDAKSQDHSKGKRAQERHGQHLDPHSRDSTVSLSSMFGTFGGVLMGYKHPRGGTARGNADADASTAAAASDVESGPHSATDTEIEILHFENGLGRSAPESAHVTRTNPPGETLTVIITLGARMVLVPLVVTPIMFLASQLGWGGEVFKDPVFIVSSMLLIASPPALTLAQISQRAKATSNAATDADKTDADAFSPFERLLSRTVFWAYLVLTPPLTIISVMVGLSLIEA